MQTHAPREDAVLRQLQEEFTGHRIWRSRRWDGQAGDWVATLLDRAAGVDPTVIRSDAEALRTALVEERERAAGRTKRAW
ncbi:hypothetical protein [Actinomadura opuntiae]|uniref:hypothetical protein n=1 Tax=Actinomadura sp. OS1-43 TaxID=604315 RepID=UPI00255B1999|nr:hypothetical protein [Actinomadura sp. OS1-43]MDL4815309.1 hypothetical protein [Actinomadura sp. OS1-43]